MVNYKSIRIINGKPKKVIVDENGDIINNNPTTEELRLSISDEYIPKRCRICGSTKTYIDNSGKYIWHRYKDKGGVWNGRSYLCHKCNHLCWYKNIGIKDYGDIKYVTNVRSGNIDKSKAQGMVIITQAVVAKVLRINDLNIENDNFGWHVDMKNDIYGNIDVKYSCLAYIIIGTLKYELWKFKIGRNINCCTCILLCLSKDWKDIDRVYIIPRDIIDVSILGIYPNNSKYAKFIVDNTPFDNAYHDIMLYLKDKIYFSIEDIMRWMNL